MKGIFARDSLLLTGEDLGIYRFAGGAERLPRGQLMLVLLGRQGENFFNCNIAATLSQSIPRLDGETTRSCLRWRRRHRDDAFARPGSSEWTFCATRLKKATGRAVSPLLLALGRRALLAARADGVTEAILPSLKSSTASTREVAARTLGDLFAADRAGQGAGAQSVAKALVESLETAGPDVAARVAVIDALGSLGEKAGRDPAVAAWLKNGRVPSTLAETAARLRTLARLVPAYQKDAVARAYQTMPFDAAPSCKTRPGERLFASIRRQPACRSQRGLPASTRPA